MKEALTIRKCPQCGSQKDNCGNIDRWQYKGVKQLINNYFDPNAQFSTAFLIDGFECEKSFMTILNEVLEVDGDYEQKKDVVGILGLFALQKVIVAHRILCYGLVVDAIDEYMRIGESMIMHYLEKFCVVMITKFGAQYLKKPSQDYNKQLAIDAKTGFPNMLKSLDCTHWVWKNCLIYLQGQYQDCKGL